MATRVLTAQMACGVSQCHARGAKTWSTTPNPVLGQSSAAPDLPAALTGRWNWVGLASSHRKRGSVDASFRQAPPETNRSRSD